MLITDIIRKKRDKKELSTEEIEFFINSVVNKSAADYQISSLLMAICINSLNDRETSDLTLAMANSGITLDLSEIPEIKVDKHSTGGVADTTTLVLTPLAASLGLPVVKMSGKGLGHTGGTIDKLNSIPGFNTSLSLKQAISQVKELNAVMMEQTSQLAPADKILYSLRDVTATVESIPLIASSVMSKKIASGSDAIVLDVKCGSGAFMKNIDDARKLSQTMVSIGKNTGRNVIAVITDMAQPLGNNIGNSFEVIEAIEILKGNVSGELKNTALTLGAYMLVLGKKAASLEEGTAMLEENIKNGRGLEKLREIIKAQNGNPSVTDDYSLLPKSELRLCLKANENGYISDMDTMKIGLASVETGAGRHKKDDEIDYGAGIILKKRIGDKVEAGDVMAEIYSSWDTKAQAAYNLLSTAFKIGEKEIIKSDIILDVIGAE